MFLSSLKKPLVVVAAFAALWLGARFVLPIFLPFLMGTGLALAAEPLVNFTVKKLYFPRWLGAGIAVPAALFGIVGILWLIGATAVKELGNLVGKLPDLEDTAREGMLMAQDFFVSLSEKAPDSVRPVLQRAVLNVFDDGAGILQQATGQIPTVIGTALGRVGDGAFGIGTGVLAAFFISARLPTLKQTISDKIPEKWRQKYLPALMRVKTALGGWLKAQLMLATVAYGVVAVGFLILGIDHGWLWAAVVALVDAIPVLGTGTVLVPWGLVYLLQGRTMQAVGIFCIYGAALASRTILEPRLVGKQLGIDPLITLLALYIGYRFWGILGMLFAPILTSAAKSLVWAE